MNFWTEVDETTTLEMVLDSEKWGGDEQKRIQNLVKKNLQLQNCKCFVKLEDMNNSAKQTFFYFDGRLQFYAGCARILKIKVNKQNSALCCKVIQFALLFRARFLW